MRPRLRALPAASVVFHAAAHKHVPLMEANPARRCKNNVVGTRNVAERRGRVRRRAASCSSRPTRRCNPTSVHGRDQARRERDRPCDGARARQPTRVRRGALRQRAGLAAAAWSRSSDEQIARGGPVTVTHPEMTRYFMTIPEAAPLVLQAGAMGARRRDLRARHGRAGPDRRPRARADPALGLRARRGHRDRVHRPAAGREAARGALGPRASRSPTPHPKIFRAAAQNVDPAWLEDELAELEHLVEGDTLEVVSRLGSIAALAAAGPVRGR